MSVRLVVISGPNKGATYFLKDGQNFIGRGGSSDVLLDHPQVSKRHCSVVYSSGKAELVDGGSANGTYVNGVLVKKKRLRVTDKISLGPFVLEVIAGQDARGAAEPAQNMNLNETPGTSSTQVTQRSDREKSIFKKLFYKFDETVPPVVYDFNTRHEWLVVVAAMFGLFVFFNLGLSVYPLLETAKESVLREAERRAFYIARQIADLNQEFLANGHEGMMNVDFAEKDQSVSEAIIVDLGGRVMAPGTRVNESSNNPFVLKHLAAIREGNQKVWRLQSKRSEDQSKVIVTVPIFVREPRSGLNVPKALVSLTFILNGITLDAGTIGVVYFESLVIAVFVGFFFLFLLYRLTYKIVNQVNDDIDDVLKGNTSSVTKRFKLEPMDKLIDSINSTLSRIPSLKADEGKEVSATDSEQQIIDSMMAPLQLLVGQASAPSMMLNGSARVVAMNPACEELTGIHLDSAIGQAIADVSRDEAFASMMTDLVQKAMGSGLQGASENYEFSSGLYVVHCLAIFSVPDRVEGFLFTITHSGEEQNG